MTHSPFGPSSLLRRDLCPGSYHAEKDLPEETSQAASDGTRKHEYVALRLKGVAKEIPPEDLDEVEECVEYARALQTDLALKTKEPITLVEHPFDLSWLDPLVGHGTCDFACSGNGEGHVVDWKFGHGDVMSAAENLQVLVYAVALAHDHGLKQVTAHLVQPSRSRHSVNTLKEEDFATVIERVMQIVLYASRVWAPRIPGRSQCQYCKARAACQALAEPLPIELVEREQIPAIPLSQLALMWDKLQPVRAIIGAIEGHVFSALRAGATSAEWSLKPARGHREWIEGVVPETLVGIAATIEKDANSIWKPKELRSIAQLEGEWGKAKKVAEALKPLIVMVPGNLKLERKDDGDSGVCSAGRELPG